MSERMTREQALERVRGMWNTAAADGYQHTMDVFADAMMAVQSETEARVATECAAISAQFGNTGRIGTSDHAAPRICKRFNLGSKS